MNLLLPCYKLLVPRRDALPILISDKACGGSPLARLQLERNGGGMYDESWLQKLLYDHPSVFPIRHIEPNFERLMPVCRELPLSFGASRSGALDNFFITKKGDLVLVEAKLWRNPDARRVVVAQALDYASAVFRMNYSELDAAVVKARTASGLSEKSLFTIVSEGLDDLDEAEFIDSVSSNLGDGKAIVAVVGDGIREDLTALSEIVQGHVGQRFTFALVELGIYENSDSSVRIVVPSVLAQTVLLERGVVRITQSDSQRSQIVIDPPQPSREMSIPKGMTFGEDEFFEVLQRSSPGTPNMLKTLVQRAGRLGIYAEVLGGLNLKHASPFGNPLNLGAVSKAGFIDFAPSTWWGSKGPAMTYNESVAKLAGASVIQLESDGGPVVRMPGNKMPKLSALLPQHSEAWLAAMDKYIRDCLADPSRAKGLAD